PTPYATTQPSGTRPHRGPPASPSCRPWPQHPEVPLQIVLVHSNQGDSVLPWQSRINHFAGSALPRFNSPARVRYRTLRLRSSIEPPALPPARLYWRPRQDDNPAVRSAPRLTSGGGPRPR